MSSKKPILFLVLLAVFAVQIAGCSPSTVQEKAEQGDADDIASIRKKAEQGDADAQYNLGFMYANGRGVPKDEVEAVNWYRKAAEQGNAYAQFDLGLMYDTGQGVAKDYKEAVIWYRKAAEQGLPIIEKGLTSEQRAEGQRMTTNTNPVLFAGVPNTAAVLDRAMKIADKNKDGKLTLEEFKPLDVQARNHADEHFERGDANKDGFLDRAELAAELAQKQTWFVILCEGVRPCFARLDSDRNKKLDAKEYRKISKMGGHSEQHFSGADTDKNGFLNVAEFAAHAEAKLKSAANPKKRKHKKKAS
jgi:TPR repeat protein